MKLKDVEITHAKRRKDGAEYEEKDKNKSRGKHYSCCNQKNAPLQYTGPQLELTTVSNMVYPQEQQGGRSVQRSRSDWTGPLLTDTMTDPTRGLSSPANDICDGERAETRSRTEFGKHRSSPSLNLAISSEFLEHYGLRTRSICPQLAWSWGVFTCCKQPANAEKGTHLIHSLDCWL